MALYDVLSRDHDVWVMAPDGDRSGKSQSITLHDAIKTTPVDKQIFSCNGTPADCVAISLLGAIPKTVDMVVSGINLGPNLGTDLIYSGTAAAARQAALENCPGIAVSLDQRREPYDFSRASGFISENLAILRDLWKNNHFININIPSRLAPDYSVEITHPSIRKYEDELVSFKAPRGDTYYFLSGKGIESSDLSGEDSSAILKGNISVSPVYLHPFNHKEDDLYRKAPYKRLES
jgi:5'-nucleotidase